MTKAYAITAAAIAAETARVDHDLEKFDISNVVALDELELAPLGPTNVHMRILAVSAEHNVAHAALARVLFGRCSKWSNAKARSAMTTTTAYVRSSSPLKGVTRTKSSTVSGNCAPGPPTCLGSGHSTEAKRLTVSPVSRIWRGLWSIG